jgi:hypothetical protein
MNYGYWRIADAAGSFNTQYSTGTVLNGTWTLSVSWSSLASTRKYISSQLVFGDAFQFEDITSTKPNKSCATKKCVQTGTIYLATNNGYPTGQGLSGFYTVGGCKWNGDDNAAAWFSFKASSSTVELSLSGMSKRLQSVVVKPNISSPCTFTSFSLVTGGCPSTMINSSDNPVQYFKQSYTAGNGLSQNHGYTLTGLTPGDEYILVLDGEGSVVSNFYLEIKSGADNGCCPNVTMSNAVNGSCSNTNGDITVTPSGGSSYTYDFGSGFGASNSKTGIAPGTYSYTVKESSGCTYPGSYTIPTKTTPAAPTVSNQSFCLSGTVFSLTPAGLSWYANASGGSPLAGGTALANNTNYYATQTSGGCESGRSSMKVTLDAKSTKPTSIAANPNTNVCHGVPVVLTAAGAILAGTSQYVWGTSSGGSQLGTTAANTTTQTPSATTTYYVGVTANGTCPADYLTTGVTVTLPSKGDRIAGNNEAATCYLSGSNPIHFYHSSGRYIGAINPKGNTGTVTMTSYINTWGSAAGVNDGTIYAGCTTTGNELYRTAYMKRGFTVQKSGAISGGNTMNIYFPFTQSEYSDLATRSTSGTAGLGNSAGNPNDNVTGLGTIVATKYDGTNENSNAADNCTGGTSTVLTQTGSGLLSAPYSLSPAVINNSSGTTETINYVSFNVTSFSEFHFHGINNNSPLPITLTRFSGNCDKNGVNLTWTTATETNVNHFEVERSRDGKSWELIANVQAIGNSSVANSYSYVDKNGFDMLYYRLRSVDNDGTSETFNPISVSCNDINDSWSLYPIPANDAVTITINSSKNIEDVILVIDMNGRLVQQQAISLQKGINALNLTISQLAKGSYVVKLKNNAELAPIRLMKID